MSDAAQTTLDALVAMSLKIGRPERELVILGEGNTSADVADGTFWIKASGTQLPHATPDCFVRLYTEPVCAIADRPACSDDEFKSLLEAARVDADDPRRPSVETVLHALAIREMGARFIAHTHPIAVNAIMCSIYAEEAVRGRLFPDEIVVCGPAPAYVPYTDPGFELAVAVRRAMHAHADEWGMPPKVILMQNHGLIALGATAQEVDNITAMYVKTCRVLLGAYALGGPRFLTEDNVDRIHTRPDESYRRRALHIE
jgi:rhamnose utilization protein RhaD (predicted bifunctional aldolase and dehydrogenase)